MFWWLVACSGSLQARVEALEVPDGLQPTLYATVPGARSLALADDGTVVVGTRDAGKVWAVRDDDGDGEAETVVALASGLDTPNGVAVDGLDVYVAEQQRVVRLPGALAALGEEVTPEVVASGMPGDDHHGWRYLAMGPDRALYVSVGAPCNVCDEALPYAAIHRIEGGELVAVATGVRNSVGFAWEPGSGALWFTDNGRDGMGDDVPVDELNRLDREGEGFGFPACHGGDVPDPVFGTATGCDEAVPPVVGLDPHGAALGLAFAVSGVLPEPFTDALLIAQHGSWDRSEPSGYRVVAYDREEGGVLPFVEGWLRDDGTAWGRPVDVLELFDGSVLISDDEAGALVRVAPEE